MGAITTPMERKAGIEPAETATRKNGTSFRRDICFAARPLALPQVEGRRDG